MNKMIALAALGVMCAWLPDASFAASVFAKKVQIYQDVYVPAKPKHASSDGYVKAAYGKRHAYGSAYKRRAYVKRRGYRKARRYYGRAKGYYRGRSKHRSASFGRRHYGHYQRRHGVLELVF